MNILFTYITPFNPERGGIGRVTDSLTKELQRRGHKVFYLIYPSYLNPFGVKDISKYQFPAELFFLPAKDLLSLTNIQFYLEFLSNKKIDVVINQSGTNYDSFLWIKSIDLGIPIISCIHQSPLQSYDYMFYSYILPLRNDKLIEKIKRIARLFIYRKVRKEYFQREFKHYSELLSMTTYLCLLSEKFYPKLDKLKINFPYKNKLISIANPNTFSKIEKVNLNKKKKQILYVGLFNAAKGTQRLIKIWNKIYQKFPDWEMIIVGTGEDLLLQRLKRLGSKLPRLRFEGLQKPEKYYIEASIFCMTSNYEGWGMVLTEAMQFGCVPIAFESYESITDIITNKKDGFLIKPFDIKEYVRKLELLMSDQQLRKKLASNAIESVKRFDIDKVADKWEIVLNKVKNNEKI